MNPAELQAKWRPSGSIELTERSAAQQHFLDLCELLDHPKPADVDPKGELFTFEKGAAKRGGSDGWADVWKRGYFAFEYKGRHKDLDAAYRQLDEYRAALENPPLLVTCDMDRIVVHTNFTATRQEAHEIPLDALGEPRNLEILRAVFHAPHKLKPGTTSEAITTEAARRAAEIAVALRERGLDPLEVARFLDRVVFSLFAEDIGLLPEGLFTRVLEKSRRDPPLFRRFAEQLFAAMALLHPRHSLRARPRPRQALPARRPLHQPGGHRDPYLDQPSRSSPKPLRRLTPSTPPAAPGTSSTSPSRSSRTWRRRSPSSPWTTASPPKSPSSAPGSSTASRSTPTPSSSPR